MQLLSTILPGLRHIRAPLAAGYLWVVCGWLLLSQTALTGKARAIQVNVAATSEWLGRPASLAILTFSAYLLGLASVVASDAMVQRMLGRIRQIQFARFEREWNEDLKKEGHEAASIHERKEVDRRRKWLLQELSLLPVRLVHHGKTAFVDEFDRRRGELSFLGAVTLPLTLVCIAFCSQIGGRAWALLLLPVLLLCRLAIEASALNRAEIDYYRTEEMPPDESNSWHYYREGMTELPRSREQLTWKAQKEREASDVLRVSHQNSDDEPRIH